MYFRAGRSRNLADSCHAAPCCAVFRHSGISETHANANTRTHTHTYIHTYIQTHTNLHLRSHGGAGACRRIVCLEVWHRQDRSEVSSLLFAVHPAKKRNAANSATTVGCVCSTAQLRLVGVNTVTVLARTSFYPHVRLVPPTCFKRFACFRITSCLFALRFDCLRRFFAANMFGCLRHSVFLALERHLCKEICRQNVQESCRCS